ncbi:addiction module toxin RelE [Enterococcus hirae]|nr:addiction module toxin RelE [Enterococcus hirae]
MAVSEETIQKLQWIVKEDQKKNKKRIYPCDSLERIITNMLYVKYFEKIN